MVGQGEAVGLVPYALKEVETLGVSGKDYGLRHFRYEQLLVLFSKAGHRDEVHLHLPHDLQSGVKLAPAPIDDDEVRGLGPSIAAGLVLLQAAGPLETPLEYLLHHGVVVGPLDRLNT